MPSSFDLSKGYPYQESKGYTSQVSNSQTSGSLLSAATTYGLTVNGGSGMVPVCPRAHGAYDQQDIASTSLTYRTFLPITDPSAVSVLLEYGNGQSLVGVGGDFEGSAQPITIAASIEGPDGTLQQLYFNGSRTVTIQPNQWVRADFPANFGSQVVANDKFGNPSLVGVWCRTWVQSAGPVSRAGGTTSASSVVTDAAIATGDAGKYVTGTGIPANSYVGAVTAGVSFVLMSASTQAAVNATATGTPTLTYNSPIPLNFGSLATNDASSTGAQGDFTKIGSSTPGGGANTYVYGPSRVLARATSRKPIWVGIGDSIIDGYSEDFHSAFYGSFARAAQNLNLPAVKLCRGGESSISWTTASGRRARAHLVEGATHCLVAIGTNDGALSNAAGVVTLTNRFVAISSWLSSLGIKAYLTTVPPRTTSTDAWATVANQTVTSGALVAPLASQNGLIRNNQVAGYQPLYLDLADICMSARDSGFWAPNATTDGVHPTGTISTTTLTNAVMNLMAAAGTSV